MKAPEKIYLRKRNKLPLEVVCDKWYETDLQNIYGSVEYTRTDAFIEKACEFFAPYIPDNSGGYERAAVIEDFKNYIKGE
jgi:hypothetical protein